MVKSVRMGIFCFYEFANNIIILEEEMNRAEKILRIILLNHKNDGIEPSSQIVAINLTKTYLNEKVRSLTIDMVKSDLKKDAVFYLYNCDKEQANLFVKKFGGLYKKRFHLMEQRKNVRPHFQV